MATILVKKGAGTPSPDDLQEAELALDVVDGALYSKLADGTVVHLNDGADDVDLSDYVTEAPKDTKQYARQDGDWSEIVVPDGGTGASVHIGAAPPANPEEGQQWLETPDGGDAKMWIWDGAVWLEQPSNGGGDVDLSDYYTKTEANNAFKPASYTAPVDSVNGQTGEVALTASDVGALPDTTVIPPPTDLTGYATEEWVNGKGYSTYTGADAVKTSGNQSIGGAKTFTSNVTAPDFVATSDERAKEQISPMPVGLIDDIKPVQWTWKDSGEKSAGVIAQQLQEIGLDDFVKEDENGMLGVNYNALISILIAEVISLKKDRQ